MRDKNTFKVCRHKGGHTEGLQITIITTHCHFIFYDYSVCDALTLEYKWWEEKKERLCNIYVIIHNVKAQTCNLGSAL